jgi:TolA-binding protein
MNASTQFPLSAAALCAICYIYAPVALAQDHPSSTHAADLRHEGVTQQFLRDIWHTLRVNTPKRSKSDQDTNQPEVIAGLRGTQDKPAIEPYWKGELENSHEFRDAIDAFALADELVASRDLDQAGSVLENFVLSYPESPLKLNAQLALGLIYSEQGQINRSISVLSTVASNQAGSTSQTEDPIKSAADRLLSGAM